MTYTHPGNKIHRGQVAQLVNGRKSDIWVPGLPSTRPQALLGRVAWSGFLRRASCAPLKSLVTADTECLLSAKHSPKDLYKAIQPHEVGIVTIPVLQMMEPRHR